MDDKIFKSTSLSCITLKNRIIRSATHEGMANEKGCPTEELRKKYIQLAEGEVGAIITGNAGIRKDGKSHLPRMLMIDSDDCIGAYEDLVSAVHNLGTPIILQIVHCGRQTSSKITGKRTVAPSAIKDKFFTEDIPKELNNQDIHEIIDSFVKAIVRAKKAGFDGVQLHAAHGYLLSEFLSPYMNCRKDKWGGNTENRFRIIDEIFKKSREQIGKYPILAKINGHEGRKNGMNIQEATKIAQFLEKAGCAAIEVSCGIFEDGFYSIRCHAYPIEAAFRFNDKFINIPHIARPVIKFLVKKYLRTAKPINNYNLEAAKAIKNSISIPVITVGGIKRKNDIEAIINEKIDFVSMCRPFIIEPDIVKKFKDNKQLESKCVYCNYCVVGINKHPLKCYYDKMSSC